MGLNEGTNVFFDEEGKLLVDDFYVPAYIRRYPYLLARLRPDSDELSLCFDPTCDLVGEHDEGNALFDGENPTDATQGLLDFCRNGPHGADERAQHARSGVAAAT